MSQGTSPSCLSDLLFATAQRVPERVAVSHAGGSIAYGDLAEQVARLAAGLSRLPLETGDRVVVYAPKSIDTVALMFATAMAGLILVVANPLLRTRQMSHLLRDSGARMLITSSGRFASLQPALDELPSIDIVCCLDGADHAAQARANGIVFASVLELASACVTELALPGARDTAALFYTSGSTGLPKGVMVSHGNLVAGAQAVTGVIGNDGDDRLLALLPLSFDAGFSQLTTGFLGGSTVVLGDHFLPRDTLVEASQNGVTGLIGVPPLWQQLVTAQWPTELCDSMRFFGSTGGVVTAELLDQLCELMPRARPYLMYGLTEAFRATILPPKEVHRRTNSIGLPLPGAKIHVLRADGSECDVNEAGELVQSGALVAQGYWNNPDATARRFRPLPAEHPEAVAGGMAVWSGDIVRRDQDGFLYFLRRGDDLIKTSGYRVSAAEIESLLLESPLVAEAVVVGVPDSVLGQALIGLCVPKKSAECIDELMSYCREQLPSYMVPREIRLTQQIPRGLNGKYDRTAVQEMMTGRDHTV